MCRRGSTDRYGIVHKENKEYDIEEIEISREDRNPVGVEHPTGNRGGMCAIEEGQIDLV